MEMLIRIGDDIRTTLRELIKKVKTFSINNMLWLWILPTDVTHREFKSLKFIIKLNH